MTPTVEILRRARELLVRDGWAQHVILSGDGRRCLMGAIIHAGQPTPADPEGNRRWAAVEPVCKVIGHRFIGQWNDAPGRTFEEVLAAFDRAITMEEAKVRG